MCENDETGEVSFLERKVQDAGNGGWQTTLQMLKCVFPKCFMLALIGSVKTKWAGVGGVTSKVFLKQIHPIQLIDTGYLTYSFIKAFIWGHELNKNPNTTLLYNNKIPAACSCSSKWIGEPLICCQVTPSPEVCSLSCAICQVLGMEW